MATQRVVLESWDQWSEPMTNSLKAGVIDRDATRVFLSGQCHSLALALHRLTGWQIVGLYGWDDEFPLTPGHVVVRDEQGEYVDVEGRGALTRYEKRIARGLKRDKVQVRDIEPEEYDMLEGYFAAQPDLAMPFAKTVLRGLHEVAA